MNSIGAVAVNTPLNASAASLRKNDPLLTVPNVSASIVNALMKEASTSAVIIELIAAESTM